MVCGVVLAPPAAIVGGGSAAQADPAAATASKAVNRVRSGVDVWCTGSLDGWRPDSLLSMPSQRPFPPQHAHFRPLPFPRRACRPVGTVRPAHHRRCRVPPYASPHRRWHRRRTTCPGGIGSARRADAGGRRRESDCRRSGARSPARRRRCGRCRGCRAGSAGTRRAAELGPGGRRLPALLRCANGRDHCVRWPRDRPGGRDPRHVPGRKWRTAFVSGCGHQRTLDGRTGCRRDAGPRALEAWPVAMAVIVRCPDPRGRAGIRRAAATWKIRQQHVRAGDDAGRTRAVLQARRYDRQGGRHAAQPSLRGDTAYDRHAGTACIARRPARGTDRRAHAGRASPRYVDARRTWRPFTPPKCSRCAARSAST